MTKQIRYDLLILLTISPLFLTACEGMIPIHNPPAYQAFQNKPKHFSKTYCVIEEKDIRPWAYKGLSLDAEPCVDHISVDFSKRVIGKVTPQNSYKLNNATIVYNTSSIELTILDGPFAGKTATKRIPNNPDMAYLP